MLTNSACLFCVQAEETKIIYHIDGEDTPYLVKIPLPPESVTLADFKAAVNKPNFKYYFKQMDADFGSVTLCSTFPFRELTSRVNSTLGVLKSTKMFPFCPRYQNIIIFFHFFIFCLHIKGTVRSETMLVSNGNDGPGFKGEGQFYG